MTVSDHWLLPDGVEDILPPLAGQIERLRRDIMDTCQRWGYQLVIPPLIEYLESLFTGTGNDLALQTFKLTDQLTGRLMGVRADITPQAARIDAHTLRQSGVTRLCYAGHVLHTRPQHLLTGRTPIQAGCELFGSASEAADREIMSLMLETLHVAGLDGLHLDLSHVGIVEALIREADFAPEVERRVLDAMRRKSIPELDLLLAACPQGSAGDRLSTLARISGGRESVAQARQQLTGSAQAVMDALDQLERTADTLAAHHPSVTVGFDFCELRGYNYHTGLVFAAYVPGHGEAVAKGGRYDAIGRDFGRARPATGFSIDVRALVALCELSTPEIGAIWAPACDDPELAAVICRLRVTETVVQAMPDESVSDQDSGLVTRRLVKQGDQWVVEVLSGAQG